MSDVIQNRENDSDLLETAASKKRREGERERERSRRRKESNVFSLLRL